MAKLVITLSTLIFVDQQEALMNGVKSTSFVTLSCIVKKNGQTYFKNYAM